MIRIGDGRDDRDGKCDGQKNYNYLFFKRCDDRDGSDGFAFIRTAHIPHFSPCIIVK